MKKVLVTCPPMLGLIDEFMASARDLGLELIPTEVEQTLSEEELIGLLPGHSGWIIGDDPATREVLGAAKAGGLCAAVKWGIGVDNVDFGACSDLGIAITNTPFMFGREVADMAMAYVVGLARQLFFIDREIRQNRNWPKPAGVSLADKTVALVGLGDIGRNTAIRMQTSGMKVIAYDPGVADDAGPDGVERAVWPNRLEDVDFIVLTCSLNEHNRHMLNSKTLGLAPKGVFVVNVSRGPLIKECDLIDALNSGHVRAAALDVFENEPLPADSPLRAMGACIFGSHNGSNTVDAVRRASFEAMKKTLGFSI
jgi:D-3-phosphoglycerate dehydrogenase